MYVFKISDVFPSLLIGIQLAHDLTVGDGLPIILAMSMQTGFNKGGDGRVWSNFLLPLHKGCLKLP